LSRSAMLVCRCCRLAIRLTLPYATHRVPTSITMSALIITSSICHESGGHPSEGISMLDWNFGDPQLCEQTSLPLPRTQDVPSPDVRANAHHQGVRMTRSLGQLLCPRLSRFTPSNLPLDVAQAMHCSRPSQPQLALALRSARSVCERPAVLSQYIPSPSSVFPIPHLHPAHRA
jgi:hypothetical protein